MIERTAVGTFPAKHHIALRDSAGALLHEECITQDGFEGPYTIAYHLRAPHTVKVAAPKSAWTLEAAAERPLAKRHYRSQELKTTGGEAARTRVPLLFNADVTLGIVKPDADDTTYFCNVDGDELFYVHAGGGTVRTQFGDLAFVAEDYVFLPRGTIYRFLPTQGAAQHWLFMELKGGLHLPRQWRNEVGQLRMDAPYSHRDFKKVQFRGPLDEGLRDLTVKRGERLHGFAYKDSPLDVVGWDGAVYPWVFPILNFQPRAGLVHLPPTWHGTFASRGSLICSFVPRMVDFHPEAIPCPYPHSSVDVDEFIFYCRGNFTSRRGVAPGSISHHPPGIPHGPHPGAYEGSIGHKSTSEMAVMLDLAKPLHPTPAALAIEDAGYHDSFIP
ncbi:MAG: homogentisate 1,2-dioxygenase [Deltaproteobacteria bacterium]|nr:homogentisate 1,2-dioxygenase [Deltaproteobacteria bacterium]